MKQHTLHNNDKIGLLKGNTNSRQIDSFLGRPFFGVLFQSVDFSRKAGGCLTFLLHSTECSTETKGKEKEKGERANKVRFKTFFICSQRREREKREREEKTPMFE